MSATSEAFSLSDLRSLKDLAAEFPRVLSMSTLRYQLRDRRNNGLSTCCLRVGRRLMISKARYEQWLASRSEVPA